MPSAPLTAPCPRQSPAIHMRRTRHSTSFDRAHKRVDAGCRCSYFVLMSWEETKGDRWLRLGDLARHEIIVVRCPCERSVEFPPGFGCAIGWRRICSCTISNSGCGARGATPERVFGSGAAAIVRSRGWSGWWRGVENRRIACGKGSMAGENGEGCTRAVQWYTFEETYI